MTEIVKLVRIIVVSLPFTMALSSVSLADDFVDKQCPAPQLKEMESVIKAAEEDILRAKKQNAVWTVALDALVDAKRAAATNNCSLAIKSGLIAREFVKLGIQQKGLKSYTVPGLF